MMPVSLGQHWVANPIVTYHAGPGIEEPVPVAHPGGLLANTHKLTGNVFHQGDNIMLAGHDCGPIIRHLVQLKGTPPPVWAAWSLLCTIGSERKCGYSSSLVKMCGEGTGLSGMAENGAWLSACGDVPLPSWVVNCSSTVFVGMTSDDLDAGWYNYSVDALFGAVSAASGASVADLPGVDLPNPAGVAKSLIKGGIDYHFKGKGGAELGVGFKWLGGGGAKYVIEFERDKANGKYLPRKVTEGVEASGGLLGDKVELKKSVEDDGKGGVKKTKEGKATHTDWDGTQRTHTRTTSGGRSKTETTEQRSRTPWNDNPRWEKTSHEEGDTKL